MPIRLLATPGMLVATRCSATNTEKGRFEGCLVDILFISSLFKCDLIYYSNAT
jgi:hypothetical protein